MLLRMTWLMAIIYPIVVILIIDEVRVYEYITKLKYAFQLLGDKIMALHTADVLILASGLVGAIISGFVIKLLRKQGYQCLMFNFLKKGCVQANLLLNTPFFVFKVINE